MNTNHKKAMTLVELLLATTLIGIVMLGVIAVTTAIKQFQLSGADMNISAMQITGALKRIARDASIAVNYPNSPGTIIDAGSNSVSFRQDQDSDLLTQADAIWVIYTDGSDGNPQTIHRCQQNAPNSDPDFGNECSPANAQFIINKVVAFTPAFDATTGLFTVAVTTRNDPNKPFHPTKNPEFQLSTDIRSYY